MPDDKAPIRSRDNPWYRRIRRAMEKYDEEIVLEGKKQIQDAIANGWAPLVLASDGRENFASSGRPPLVFSPALFSSLSDTTHPQGLIGLFTRPESNLESLFEDPSSVIVALDAVQDPGNVGTIIRLAAAFEAAGVALTEGCADPFSPRTIRASAGAVLLLPVCSTTRKNLLDMASHRKYPIYAAEGKSRKGSAAPPSARAVLVFGSEGQGVHADLSRGANRLTIQVSTRVESINVAAAAAILLAKSYEKRTRAE